MCQQLDINKIVKPRLCSFSRFSFTMHSRGFYLLTYPLHLTSLSLILFTLDTSYTVWPIANIVK
jgi:hypothetical protein